MAQQPRQAYLTLARGHLYKYKSLHGDNFAHVREIVRDSMIYCPRPEQLNDEEECKPKMIIGNITDPEYWPKVEAWVRRCVSRRSPPPTEAEIQIELKTLTQKKLEEMVSGATEQYHRAVNARYRIVSYSDSVKNNHLWMKYADDYQGICLQFFVDPMLESTYQVSYSDEVPALDITDNETFDALIKTYLIKRKKWMSEGEFRLVLGEPPIDKDPTLIQQRLQFPEHLLTGIVFGSRVSKEQQEALMRVARFRRSGLTYSTARRADDDSVQIEPHRP